MWFQILIMRKHAETWAIKKSYVELAYTFGCLYYLHSKILEFYLFIFSVYHITKSHSLLLYIRYQYYLLWNGQVLFCWYEIGLCSDSIEHPIGRLLTKLMVTNNALRGNNAVFPLHSPVAWWITHYLTLSTKDSAGFAWFRTGRTRSGCVAWLMFNKGSGWTVKYEPQCESCNHCRTQ